MKLNRGLLIAILAAAMLGACAEESVDTNPAPNPNPPYYPQGPYVPGGGDINTGNIRQCSGQDQVLYMSGSTDQKERLLERFFGYQYGEIRNLEGPVTVCVGIGSHYGQNVTGRLRVEFEDDYGTVALPFNYAEMTQTFWGQLTNTASGVSLDLILYDNYGMVRIQASSQGSSLVGSIRFYNFPSYQVELETQINNYQQGLNPAQLMGYNFPPSYYQNATSINDQQAILNEVISRLNGSGSEYLGWFSMNSNRIYE